MLDVEGLSTYQPDLDLTATDAFVYQIADNAERSTGPASVTVVEEVEETDSSQGFTAFTPSSDSRLIYVSSSKGSDKNNCLKKEKPCKSIAAGLEKMRSGHPDHLYLKRGDVWTEETLTAVQSGRSAKEPAVVAFYGESGDRPKIESSSAVINTSKGDKKHINFIGLHFSAYKHDPKHTEFTGARSDSSVVRVLGANANLLFEDNIFDYTAVVVQDWKGEPADFIFRRNIWTGKYYNKSSFNRDSRPSNLYVKGVDGLTIEENVFDYGGWYPDIPGAGANMFNHNIYLQHSSNGNRLVLRNNIITRASSHGVQMRSGGVAEDNFFGRNAIGLLIGYSRDPLPKGVKAHALRNVVSEGHSMVKGKEACSGKRLCTAAFWGIDFEINGDADYQAHGNIVSNRAPNDTQWRSKFKKLTRRALQNLDHPSTHASQNIAWKWDSDDQGVDLPYVNPGRTLGDYNERLGGENSFDAFMETVKSRPLQTWDEKRTAEAINAFIREGFVLAEEPK